MNSTTISDTIAAGATGGADQTSALQLQQAQWLIFGLFLMVLLFLLFMFLKPHRTAGFIKIVVGAIVLTAIGLMVGAALLWQPQVIQTFLWVGGGVAALIVLCGAFVLISRVWANHSYNTVRTVVQSNERLVGQMAASHERTERGYQQLLGDTIANVFADRYDERRVIERIGKSNYEALVAAFEGGASISGQYLLTDAGCTETALTEFSFDEQMVARKLDTIARECYG